MRLATTRSPDGSPPRVRRARDHPVERLPVVGITPACAGSTWCRRTRRPTGSDHPRVCGEHASRPAGIWCSLCFSSIRRVRPVVRGARQDGQLIADDVGITLAFAGMTRCPAGPAAIPPDHPRVRGGAYTVTATATNNTGSPPRVWGGRSTRRSPRALRITPAYAERTPG